MPKYSKNPCTQVISFRITEEERIFLNQLASHYNKSVSETMRDILLQVGDFTDQPAQ
jgi:hypothetical protein